MRLTIGQVFNAVQVLDAIIRDKRPMPQMAKYRVARMHARLLPEFIAANAHREDMIKRYGIPRADGQTEVAPDRMADFTREWELFAAGQIEVDVEPLRLVDMALGNADGPVNGPLEAVELVLLGELVTE